MEKKKNELQRRLFERDENTHKHKYMNRYTRTSVYSHKQTHTHTQTHIHTHSTTRHDNAQKVICILEF